MARMYARRKGKSGSTKLYRKEIPEWVNMSSQNVEEEVAKLYSQGYSTSEIGMILRDKYGIPSTKLVTGKKISKILEEQGTPIKVPEDLENLIIKALRLRKHIENNKKDLHNKRALNLIESKIRRLVKYYRREKVLPADWSYSPATAEMLITR
ncbi:MAG: 30S ribosomal protein S15 [Candidatus Syntrophoarchaeum caldarius]|uniref:Small ribosomal subunit protein uS15 n=1 Tax=Candidatus Syntropharchaeum caldarium TaxID=1838285 RepID=A0A1F2PBV7_9EURY|nr:MAG: 30S ribosomal protein S15 [Candidatus Syntrophoarchaeum caldarius]